MVIDRYSRVVLTIIAGALLYLCAVLTPLPAASAQTAKRPGDSTGPAEVVIVGWRLSRTAAADVMPPLPVQIMDSVQLKTTGEVRVLGTVQTEQRRDTSSRVVLVGWEERGSAGQPGFYRRLDSGSTSPSGLPVTQTPVR